MLRYVIGTAGFENIVNSILDDINFIIGSDLSGNISVEPPDVTYKFTFSEDVVRSTAVVSTMLHEFSHAVHYLRVGNIFWDVYIAAVVTNNILKHGDYGNGTEIYAPIFAVSEAWAEDRSRHLFNMYYSNLPLMLQDEEFDNRRTQFIPYGLYFDLIDDNNDFPTWGIVDPVTGYSWAQIYDSFDLTITSPRRLEDRLNNSFGTNPNINPLLTSYGF